MNFLLSISLVTHLTQLRSVRSFLVMLKWKGGSLDRGGCVEKGEKSRGGGGSSSGVRVVLLRYSVPGTNKGAKPD